LFLHLAGLNEALASVMVRGAVGKVHNMAFSKANIDLYPNPHYY